MLSTKATSNHQYGAVERDSLGLVVGALAVGGLVSGVWVGVLLFPMSATETAVMKYVTILAIGIQWSAVIYLLRRWLKEKV